MNERTKLTIICASVGCFVSAAGALAIVMALKSSSPPVEVVAADPPQVVNVATVAPPVAVSPPASPPATKPAEKTVAPKQQVAPKPQPVVQPSPPKPPPEPTPESPPPPTRQTATWADKHAFIELRAMRFGDKGKLRMTEEVNGYIVEHTAKVQQIIDEENMLVDFIIINGPRDYDRSRLKWVRGVSTRGLADRQVLDLADYVFVVTDSMTYTAIDGASRTVTCLEVMD